MEELLHLSLFFQMESSRFSLTNVEIDEDLLRNISERTSGRYFRATDNLELANIYEEINKLEKTEINETVYTNYNEKYRLYSILALIFLSIEVISRKPYIKVLFDYVSIRFSILFIYTNNYSDYINY